MPDLSRDVYSEDEWRGLLVQVTPEAVARTVQDLRRAVAERRRFRWGALNGLALLAALDAAEQRAGECEAGLAARDDAIAQLEQRAEKAEVAASVARKSLDEAVSQLAKKDAAMEAMRQQYNAAWREIERLRQAWRKYVAAQTNEPEHARFVRMLDEKDAEIERLAEALRLCLDNENLPASAARQAARAALRLHEKR